MDNRSVIWKKDNGICFITMNEPKTLNAISKAIVAGLEEAFEDCFDEEIRAVVLTGAGRAFCAGETWRKWSRMALNTGSCSHLRNLG